MGTEDKMNDNFNIIDNETIEKLPSLEDCTAEELAQFIGDVLYTKKAHDIQKLHVGKQTVIAEEFVLCTGSSGSQVRALTDEVEYRTEQRGVTPIRVEGRDNNAWVIMDYGTVLVHIFSREARQFYNLEKLYTGEKEN